MRAGNAQSQVQERIRMRDTKSRMQNARKVESAVAELGSMFGKMASLVRAQGETLTRIEDDTEMSLLEVRAGNDEINKTREITKGNRGLIVKTFAILIGLVTFFKLF